MKVALIWPHGNDFTYSMPLGLGFLIANCTRPGVDLKIFDGTLNNAPSSSERFHEFLRTYQPDVVGVSCWSRTYRETREVISVVKSLLPQCLVVMGGIHPTVYTVKTLEDSGADYLLIGEGEASFKAFLSALGDPAKLAEVPGLAYRKQDGAIAVKAPCYVQDLDTIALPDYEAIGLEAYLKKGYSYFSGRTRSAPVWITRGCPYSCKFCSAHMINGKRIRRHSVGYGMEWITMLYEHYRIRQINIIDDNFTFDAAYTREFCEALIRKNFKGLIMNTANGIRAQRTDFETLKLMKRAGWKVAVVAPESGSRRMLRLMKKGLDPDMWPEKVREIRRAGLSPIGLFLAGYPGETLEDLKQTEALVRRCDFDHLVVQYFQPMPGTPIYQELVEKGEIEDTLLPGTTSGRRVYVTKDLEDFNFARFAFVLYLRTFFRHPVRITQMILSYNPILIVKRLAILTFDAVFGLKKKE